MDMKAAKELTVEQARTRIQNLCSRSELCSSEVLSRLSKWGLQGPEARRLLDELIADRYVDDARFAREFVHDKLVYNRWGRIKISAALRLKKIPRDLLSAALAEISDSEYHRTLLDVMKAKARVTPGMETRESRLKVVRHALSRGFEMSLILEIEKSMRGKWESDNL